MTGDLDQLVDDILLAKLAHMNFLRLTQRPVEREVYEYADRLGLLTQTDLPLFGCLRFNKFAEAVRQSEEMERFVRGHACNVVVSFINEPFPNGAAKPHRHLTRPDLQAFFEAAERAMQVLNPDRVFKHVDGDYDPPGTTLPDNHCYAGWYNGHGVELGELHRGAWIPIRDGWAYGCGEFGSEALDTVDLMQRRYPAHWLPQGDGSSWWPSDVPGAQTGDFHYMWFDSQHSVDDWVAATRKHQEWITRMFAERFRRDNRMVSFAIHLFIDAFPASWMKSIMDVERQPKPAYFAYRNALEPLTVSIRTDRWKWTAGEPMRFEFWVANDTQLASDKLTLRWQLEDAAGQVGFAQQAPASVSAVESTFQGFFSPTAPEVDGRTAYTVRLALCDGDEVLTDTAVEVEVLPRLSSLGGDAAPVRVLGSSGLAERLVAELGAQPATDATTIARRRLRRVRGEPCRTRAGRFRRCAAGVPRPARRNVRHRGHRGGRQNAPHAATPVRLSGDGPRHRRWFRARRPQVLVRPGGRRVHPDPGDGARRSRLVTRRDDRPRRVDGEELDVGVRRGREGLRVRLLRDLPGQCRGPHPSQPDG